MAFIELLWPESEIIFCILRGEGPCVSGHPSPILCACLKMPQFPLVGFPCAIN